MTRWALVPAADENRQSYRLLAARQQVAGGAAGIARLGGAAVNGACPGGHVL